MTTDARLMILAGMLSLLPADAVLPTPTARWVIGDDERDAAPPDATGRDMTPEDQAALEAAARAYLEARRRRQADERRSRTTDPDEQE